MGVAIPPQEPLFDERYRRRGANREHDLGGGVELCCLAQDRPLLLA